MNRVRCLVDVADIHQAVAIHIKRCTRHQLADNSGTFLRTAAQLFLRACGKLLLVGITRQHNAHSAVSIEHQA